NLREPGLEGADDIAAVVDRKRRLRDVGQAPGLTHLQARDVVYRFDEVDAVVGLPHRALDLRVSRVADHDHFAAFAPHLRDLDVNLGYERAGGVEDLQAAPVSLVAHCAGD